jgi:hypothetical protein
VTDTLVRTLVRAAVPVIAGTFRKDCCLNATRVMIEVFRSFGVPARAMVVRVLAANAAWQAQALRLGRPPTAEELDEQAWAIGIGEPEPPQGEAWPGHVVCVARGLLVDMAAGNISRPMRDIHVPDVVVWPLHKKWDRGELGIEVALPKRGVLLYHAMPKSRAHEKLPGYQRSRHNLEAAREIRARVSITA